MVQGLQALDRFAGLVPLDAYDDETAYGGADADIGVYVGPAGGASAMRSIGLHRERLLLLPPNSTHVPADLLRHIEEHVTGLIAPSQWAVGILEGLTKLPVQLWRHGVDPGFRRARPGEADTAGMGRTDSYSGLISDHASGMVRVLHLASTAAQRKGTRELLLGWALARQRQWLGLQPELHMVVDGPQGVFLEELMACGNTVAMLTGRLNRDVRNMAQLYSAYHAVALPSRGEAFGMCGIEALCCGTPVIATTCTGHAEWSDDPAVVPIKTGELAPIDDGPGALAPSLDPEDVAVALRRAVERWPHLHALAHLDAGQRQQKWTWAAVTKQWWDRYHQGDARR
jgi:glycosyltransferase involved in cell wall biosynthesis